MNCEDVSRNEIAEQYVAGRLDDAARDAYEVHFFECSACLDHLQLLQSMSGGLKRELVPILVPRRRSYAPVRWLAAAAMLVLATGIGWWNLRHIQSSAPVVQAHTASAAQPSVTPAPPSQALTEFDQLARVDAPLYREPRMRGTNAPADAQFRAAMHHYQQKDYAGAIAGLSEAARLNPKSSAAQFFLGVSDLLNGNRPEAIAHLRIVAAMEDSLEAGDAHFFLGKALLGEHDSEHAVAEFRKAIAAESERTADAKRMIEAVGGVR
ncbi:MAG TPA: tetratricopeptide repeat protein [Bryobacteraceae bacterium]